jgi:hypothetical protein
VADRPWHAGDLFWETWSETALALWARGRRAAAARLWRLAADQPMEPGDPRRAASLNNLALALADPRATLDAAMAAWDAAEPWVATMAIAGRGRSSTFHLRLETRNRPALDAPGRALLRRDLDAGRAVTLANLARLAPRAEAAKALAAARDRRRAAWGPGEAGARWLDDVARAQGEGAALPPPPALPWPARRPAAFGDERRLKGAAYLAAFGA